MVQDELADREGEEEDEPETGDLDDPPAQVVGLRRFWRRILVVSRRLLGQLEQLTMEDPHKKHADTCSDSDSKRQLHGDGCAHREIGVIHGQRMTDTIRGRSRFVAGVGSSAVR